MNIFHEIGHNIDRVIENLDKILVGSMEQNEHVIIDLNRDQIEHGLGSDGVILGEYASDSYAQLKQAMGSLAPAGVWDFKLTGSFLDDIYTEPYFGSNIESSGLIIDSRDEKADMLQSKAPNVWGHTDENKPQVQEAILFDALNTIKDEITQLT